VTGIDKCSWPLCALALLLIAGCATQEVKVACDGKLQPINAPNAAKVAQVVHTATGATHEGSP
jgi:hypothetical protein